MGLFEFNSNILVFVSTSIVWSAIYSIWLFNRIFFGSLLTYKVKITLKKSKNILFSDINYSEFIVLSLLYIFMLIFGLNSLKITTFLNIPTILFISRI
jgi:NADH:ubiquinone oxidoreductase subunit 4 (subunit M)